MLVDMSARLGGAANPALGQTGYTRDISIGGCFLQLEAAAMTDCDVCFARHGHDTRRHDDALLRAGGETGAGGLSDQDSGQDQKCNCW